MAQKIQTIITDDLDGSEANGTVRFGLDGTDYVIDLNAAHVKELRKTLTKYVEAGRKAAGAGSRPVRRGNPPKAGAGPHTSEVREWARTQGIEVKDRGRIAAELMVKFQSARAS
jgi:hypothetical protein